MSTDPDFVLRVLRLSSATECYESVWWRTDGEYAPVTFFANCNDLFFWACSDSERVTPENVHIFEQAIADIRATGSIHISYADHLFCCRVRGERPQGASYPDDPLLWPLFDACGPEKEPGLGNPRKHPRDRTTQPSSALPEKGNGQ